MPRGRSSEEVEEYQDRVYLSLSRIFGERNVEKEWDAAKDSRDAFTRELYSPRLDIAVKPFNTDGNIDCNNQNVKDHPIVALIFCSTMLIVCFLGCVFIPKSMCILIKTM